MPARVARWVADPEPMTGLARQEAGRALAAALAAAAALRGPQLPQAKAGRARVAAPAMGESRRCRPTCTQVARPLLPARASPARVRGFSASTVLIRAGHVARSPRVNHRGRGWSRWGRPPLAQNWPRETARRRWASLPISAARRAPSMRAPTASTMMSPASVTRKTAMRRGRIARGLAISHWRTRIAPGDNRISGRAALAKGSSVGTRPVMITIARTAIGRP